MKAWQPNSWKHKTYAQQPIYPDAKEAQHVIDQLTSMPPLVSTHEIERLKEQLALAAHHHAFLLQGGDCAELFSECQADTITTKLKMLLQMSLVLIYGLRKPIIRVGRIAGQYAKPRSTDTETKNNQTLPSYRGDIINQADFNALSREPNPNRMLTAYYQSALTLNYIRALVDGGFANLEHPEYWNIDFAHKSEHAQNYQRIAHTIQNALNFVKAIPGSRSSAFDRVDFFTSHEALLLPYEQALTRFDPRTQQWYNLGTHFPWVGMRTAALDQGHIEYIRGLANPIAVKIGSSTRADTIKQLVLHLNPNNEAGKLTLIHRFGANNIEHCLPPLIDAVQSTNITVLWACDPMHGNTRVTNSGIKTRDFDHILTELRLAFQLHQKHHSGLSGVHFEMTGENVTECVGGASGLSEIDLNDAYKSLVDPRLNYEQALEMAMIVADQIA
jgi:3-deoxy-7-phosphoheptulonate synthase